MECCKVFAFATEPVKITVAKARRVDPSSTVASASGPHAIAGSAGTSPSMKVRISRFPSVPRKRGVPAVAFACWRPTSRATFGIEDGDPHEPFLATVDAATGQPVGRRARPGSVERLAAPPVLAAGAL